MTSKELRQAAEIAKLSDEPLMQVLADHILATVQEDGEEAVDESVICEYGFAWEEEEQAFCLGHDKEVYEMIQYGAGWKLYWSEIESWPKVITTRSQFRSLMAGLGIEPKNKSQKTIKLS